MADEAMFLADGDGFRPTEWAVGPWSPWILLSPETTVGEGGTGVARGLLADQDGPFGMCAQTLLFERRQ